MNKTVLAMLVFCILLPCIFYISKPGFLEYDSYYYLDYICHPGTEHYVNQTIVDQVNAIIFSIFPCDEFALKIILCLAYIFTIMCLFWIGEIYYKGTGAMTVLFSCITPLFFTQVFKLENDFIAIPLLFLGLALLLKGKKIESMLFFITGSLLWPAGIILLLIIGLFYYRPALIFAIPIVFMNIGSFFGSVIPNFGVAENNPLLGILWVMPYFLWSGFLRMPYSRLSMPVVVLAILNPKFFIFAIPFLALTLVKFAKENPHYGKGIFVFAIILCIAFSVPLSGIDFYSYPPKAYEHQAVIDTIQAAKDFNKPFANDWAFGHLFFYYGASTPQAFGIGDWNLANMSNTIILAREKIDCPVVRQYDNLLMSELRLYNC